MDLKRQGFLKPVIEHFYDIFINKIIYFFLQNLTNLSTFIILRGEIGVYGRFKLTEFHSVKNNFNY